MKQYFIKYRIKTFILILILTNSIAVAQPKLTGFFDVINIQKFTESDYSQFKINQFELDISYAHQSRFSLGTVIAYNNETQNMELAMAFAHYNFINEEGIHPRQEETSNHAGIIIGKFDVNFGLDYLSFASPDRPVVNQPLVYEKTIVDWNDIGIDLHMLYNDLNFHIWVINGFYEGISLGGNLRYSLLPFLSTGLSHSTDFISFSKTKANITGLDLLIATDIVEIKSEYLWAKGVYRGEQDTLETQGIHGGFYIQTLAKLKELISLPIFFTLRYGQWNTLFAKDLNGVNNYENRFTIGLGYQFHENISARLELLTNKIEDQERCRKGTLQLVVAF